MEASHGNAEGGKRSPGLRYRTSGPHVVHDRFDDEVVVINLKTGCYFGLRETAADIWDLAAGGATQDEIIASIRAAYPGPAEDVEKDVAAFLSELSAEDLVLADVSDLPRSPGSVRGPHPPPDQRRPFSAPKLAKYDDQKELLLLDPIHEVGELGWPEK